MSSDSRFGPSGLVRPADEPEKDTAKGFLEQYRTVAIMSFVLLTLAYAAANLAFGQGDWREVVTVIEIGLSFVVFVFLRRMMFERFDGVYIFGDADNAYLNTNTVISLCLGAGLFIYMQTRATDFMVSIFKFPDGLPFIEAAKSVLRTTIIFVFISLSAPLVAMLLKIAFEEDPRPYRGAVDTGEKPLDWPSLHKDGEAYQPGSHPTGVDSRPKYQHDIRVVNSGTLSRDMEERLWDIACEEFLEGLESGAFSEDERSWRGVRLTRSGYNLTAVGDKIRDQLISDGWATWKHPTQRNQGWELLATPSEIIDGWRIPIDPERKAAKMARIKVPTQVVPQQVATVGAEHNTGD